MIYYLALVVLTTAGFTLVYNVGLAVWEETSQPLYRSLEVVVQTFTTTGYGEDAPWESLPMNLLVIGMQLAGIGLILAAVDVFAVPWLRDVLSADPPARVEAEGHVLICGYTPRAEAFIAELESRGSEYVVLTGDEGTALSLHEDGIPVVYGDPESTDALGAAGIEDATAVVTDAPDDTTASIVLSVRDANPDVRVVTLVEDRTLEQYHDVAGADEVLSPRQLLGESLARRVPTAVSAVIDEGITVGEEFQLVELPIEEGSEMSGTTVAEAAVRERFGVHVIGAWFGDEFETPLDPDTPLQSGATLLVLGDEDGLTELESATASTRSEFGHRNVIVAGYGQTGSAAVETLADTPFDPTVLDIEDLEGVDVVGDARDPGVLTEAGVEDASALILTVGDDTTAIFTTLLARELNPDLDIVVRANEGTDPEKLYRAGADYVQSLATVSGRMMASTVFEDEETLAYDRRIEVVRLPAGSLAGETLVSAPLREEVGVTALAVVRDGETILDLDPDSEFQESDDVILAGTVESLREFRTRYGT